MQRLFPFFLLCILGISFGQGPDTLWTRKYEKLVWYGSGLVEQTIDGGYVLGGIAAFDSIQMGDFYLIKTDSIGDTIWTKTHGTEWDERMFDLKQTADSGYITTGFYHHPTLGRNLVVLKLNQNGDTVWSYEYASIKNDEARSISLTVDGGCIVAGYTEDTLWEFDFFLIKFDSLGNCVWSKRCYQTDWQEPYEIQQTSDSGYIVVGQTYEAWGNNRDIFVLKTDVNGDSLWTRTFGGDYTDIGRSVKEYNDGYMIVGTTNSYGSNTPQHCNIYLIKVDLLGDTLWTKTYGHWLDAQCTKMKATSDSHFVIVGTNNLYDARGDVYLIKVKQSDGFLRWEKWYDLGGGDVGHGLDIASDGGYIISGRAAPGVLFLLKTKRDTFSIKENKMIPTKHKCFGPTIFTGPLQLPQDKSCKVFDITGRVVMPDKIKPGIYFIEVEGKIIQKVVKVR